MSEQESIVCGRHGGTRSTFVCRHVAAGVACGFHTAELGDDPWPDAWCDACDELQEAAGGWTDETTTAADLRVLCTHCWEQARARNQAVAPLVRRERARLTLDEQQKLIDHAIHEVRGVQAASDATWGWLRMGRWHYDADARTIVFSGVRSVVADVRLVGSYATRSRTFQWSWVLDGLQSGEVAALRDFGEVRGMERLGRPWWECPIEEAWAMASLAGYVLGCEGIYRAPFPDSHGDEEALYWFMLLSGWRVHESPS